MIDIEERLHRDAANWHDDPPPSLDDLLDALVPVRRSRRVWVFAGIAAALVAALAVALTLWPHASRRQPASHRHSVPPVTVRPLAHVPFVAVVPDPHDAKTIYAMWTDNGGPLCSPSQVRASRVDQTATSVHIVLSGVRVDDHLVHGCTPPNYQPVAVHLNAPLGDRTVFDANSARIEFDPERIPTPTYLPPGYDPLLRHPPGATPDLTVSRTYGNRSGRTLRIAYAAAVSAFVYIERHGPTIDVNGKPARFDQSSSNCLSWSPSPGLALEVCGNNRLPNSEVVKVARSLH
jgi:hypothetical protein